MSSMPSGEYVTARLAVDNLENDILPEAKTLLNEAERLYPSELPVLQYLAAIRDYNDNARGYLDGFGPASSGNAGGQHSGWPANLTLIHPVRMVEQDHATLSQAAEEPFRRRILITLASSCPVLLRL